MVRPLPQLTPMNEWFWTSGKDGRLRVQRCTDCHGAHEILDAKDAKGKRTETAKSVGTLLGDRAKQNGVTEAVFDRGGYRYHGRVKALAEGVRAAGVKL